MSLIPYNAGSILTMTGAAVDTQIVTLDAKVYTSQTVLTDVDGNVLAGADGAAFINNLIAAITLGAGAGTLYAASMTLHPTMTASLVSALVALCSAKAAGVAGEGLTTTETQTNGSFDSAATSLTGEIVANTTIANLVQIRESSELNADVLRDFHDLELSLTDV